MSWTITQKPDEPLTICDDTGHARFRGTVSTALASLAFSLQEIDRLRSELDAARQTSGAESAQADG
jgi:hypothetical protein